MVAVSAAGCETKTVVGVARDVADRGPLNNVSPACEKQLNRLVQKLRLSEEKYRSIVEHIGIGVATISPDMRILSLNRQMREWFPDVNPDARSFCYESFNDPPRRNKCSYCPTAKTLKDGQTHEEVTKTPSGKKIRNFRIIATPIRDSEGRIASAIETVEDITEQLQMRKILEESEKRQRAIFENTGTAIALIDQDMTIAMINSEFEKQSGFSRQEVEGRKKWTEFIVDRETLETMKGYHHMRRTSPASVPKSYECRFTNGSGNVRDVLVNVDMISGTKRSVASLIDITERKRMEKSLAAKAQELEELNAALNVLLKRREEDRKDLEERVTLNVEELLLPLVESLKLSRLRERDTACIDLLELHLKEIVSPFARRMLSTGNRLTPRELQVAGLIRMGKSTKEIAELLKVSKSTVDLHRHGIRKKLGLTGNRKINLCSQLLSMEKF